MSEKVPKPDDTAVRFERSDLDAIGKVRGLRPKMDEFKGEARIETNAFGRKEVVKDVPLREAVEAMKPSWRAQSEMSGNFDVRQAKETVRGPDGTTRQVLVSQVRDAVNLGLVTAVRRPGRGRTERRYYLDCGHHVESDGPPGERAVCPWGCGRVAVEGPQSQPFIKEA